MNSLHDSNRICKSERTGSLRPIIFGIFTLVLFSAGCSAPRIQLYEGPFRQSTEIAVIKTPDEVLSIIRVDNEYLEYSTFQSLLYHTKWADIVEVEPGEHKLLIMHDGLVTQAEIWIPFTAEADHIYEIRTYSENFTTVYRVIDTNTDQVIVTKYGSSQ